MTSINYKGIDYGLGSTNRDKDTGIRYGVISQHSVMPEAMEDIEYIYPGPNCPKCGNDVKEAKGKYRKYAHAEHECADYVCHDCRYVFGSESAYADESSGFKYERDGYQLADCLDSDIFVLKSDYYTFAQFCSPCVPGACSLDSPLNTADADCKCYCLGHGWFEGGIAPYPIYRVSDDKRLIAEEKMVPCTYCDGIGYRSTLKLAEHRNQTLADCETDILSGKTPFKQFNPNNHTIACFACNPDGKLAGDDIGKVKAIVISEG